MQHSTTELRVQAMSSKYLPTELRILLYILALYSQLTNLHHSGKIKAMEILKKIYYFLLDIAQTLILAAAAFVIVYMFLFRPFEVKGQSMFPNLHDSEYLITNIISQKIGDPTLGDVVVFKAPNEPDKDFIKRVIGVPGDEVMVKEGSVYLNGKKLDESKYLSDEIKTYGGSFLNEGDKRYSASGILLCIG